MTDPAVGPAASTSALPQCGRNATDRSGDLPGCPDRIRWRVNDPIAAGAGERTHPRGWFPDSRRHTVLRRRHRLLTPGTGSSSARARPSCTRSSRSPARSIAPLDAGRPALPHPRLSDGPLLRARGQLMTSSAAPPRWSTRCTDSVLRRRATCSASSTARRTRPGAGRCGRGADRRRGPGVRRRQLRRRAEVPARPRGVELRCRSRSRSGSIGRTKLDDIDARRRQAANSHIALNTIDDEDGNELEILRDNMPFGTSGAGEFGTYFIGYARSPGGHRADAERCSSASRRATTTGSSTSPPRSPARCSSSPPRLPRRPPTRALKQMG